MRMIPKAVSIGYIVFMTLLSAERSAGQTNELWLDYFATFPAGRYWSYEINPGMAKGLTSPVWLEMYVSANATYQDQNWLSTEGNLEAHYTFNPSAEDVFELRPWLGANFIWATYGGPLNLFFPSISLRLEERLFWYQSSGTNDSKERVRLRMFARFPLNNETLVEGTYYFLTLIEFYVPLNGEAREVSADKRRFQVGIGYVAASNLRIELQYIMMRSRNTELNTFDHTNNIFWLAVRNFF